MASATSPIFNGQSSFSSDFQTVLTKAVNVASLPMQALESNVSVLTAQQQALSGMQTQFASLQDAIQSIDSSTQGTVAAQSSQNSAVSATATSSALAGTYSIAVDSPGSSTTTLSEAGLNPVADPTTDNISSSTTFTLTHNGTGYTITPAGGSLIDLTNAINASDAGVQATIINVGSNSSPDYRLALTSNNLGADTIQLNDGTQNLMDTVATGSDATYQVNGSSTQLQSNSSQVTLAPGLTVSLLGTTTSGEPATITVSSDYSSLQSALQNFATAYNAAVSAVQQETGQNAGPLAGQSTIYALSNLLQNIAQYTGSSGTVQNLSALGLDLDSTGQLSFDPSNFSSDSIAAVQQFLGSASGSGFLNMANNAVTSVADPTTGLLQTDSNQLSGEITNTNNQISDDQNRVNTMETNLQAQLTAADAAIATLESQKTYFTDLFDAEYLNNTGTSSS